MPESLLHLTSQERALGNLQVFFKNMRRECDAWNSRPADMRILAIVQLTIASPNNLQGEKPERILQICGLSPVDCRLTGIPMGERLRQNCHCFHIDPTGVLRFRSPALDLSFLNEQQNRIWKTHSSRVASSARHGKHSLLLTIW